MLKWRWLLLLLIYKYFDKQLLFILSCEYDNLLFIILFELKYLLKLLFNEQNALYYRIYNIILYYYAM